MRAELEESPHCFICLPGSSAAGVPPRGLWRGSSLWGYLVGMLHFGMEGDFLWLWGPLLVGGAALQRMVSQCCPSEVQAPVTTTELSWVVILLWEQETQESFPAP